MAFLFSPKPRGRRPRREIAESRRRGKPPLFARRHRSHPHHLQSAQASILAAVDKETRHADDGTDTAKNPAASHPLRGRVAIDHRLYQCWPSPMPMQR